MENTDHEIFDSLARSNVNSAWAAVCMEVLSRLGVEHVVISPGSRSTPLTVAAARNPKLDAIPILDERSAGFYALGLAKRSHKPVVLVCTSGTAAANYFPAVIEASMSGTPLLVFSADRPPELRDCSSGQTIDQFKLFGAYVRSFHEMALPEVSAEMLAYLRQRLVHAVDQATHHNPGPVHLNFPFRDPLAPSPADEPVVGKDVLEDASTVLTRICESVSLENALDTVAGERLASHTHGLIVVGDVNPKGGNEPFTDAVAMLSQKLGWPVLADVLNPLRGHAGEMPALVCNYDAILRDASSVDELSPTAVLQIGPLPTSKVLRQWLSRLDAVGFLLAEFPANTDPLHRVAVPMTGEVHRLAEHLSHQRSDPDWTLAWSTREIQVRKRIETALKAEQSSFEGKAAWLLSGHLPVGTPVFLAGSMSVRYAEWFWAAGNRACPVLANRGANGIDGTLGTAMGMAHGNRPSILLTGDLAFLHDSNALLAASRMQGSLTVVCLNNNGGGIFELLPVASLEPPFEAFFATPQEVDLAKLADAHGVAYQCIDDWDTFVRLINHLPARGLRVLELKTDRKVSRTALKQILNPN
ncbi:2-succinyl-5-enolpyruvyl-6-hydroxy-3-cyclohexene-1-carboxylic-acid synthase [Coraliomargarita parva]|uniref:2-succinyl-5-enolpyruvyl-6-hydroxy-3- cyclohexene-1-carboxylic-acid synthase n=1 Tax=Coraliomargarita parva TaxID=3014050 RepID=UPI0022B4F001|nr:2-succinyl-5-enolpyruvyl-6-hydroxy-3-cyclohexene-1-carboxylic-acid synthase [Coraliomargarita parva]